jgi:hypothetical protein
MPTNSAFRRQVSIRYIWQPLYYWYIGVSGVKMRTSSPAASAERGVGSVQHRRYPGHRSRARLHIVLLRGSPADRPFFDF